jgi:hypothetical protein
LRQNELHSGTVSTQKRADSKHGSPDVCLEKVQGVFGSLLPHLLSTTLDAFARHSVVLDSLFRHILLVGRTTYEQYHIHCNNATSRVL